MGPSEEANPGDPGRREHGSVTLETVITVPAVMLLLALLVFAGRLGLAQHSVDAAAFDAARAASLERDPSSRSEAARTAVGDSLDARSLHCTPEIVVTATPADPVTGTPGAVVVHVTCHVGVADLSLPGVPGTTTLHGEATSPVDLYRAPR